MKSGTVWGQTHFTQASFSFHDRQHWIRTGQHACRRYGFIIAASAIVIRRALLHCTIVPSHAPPHRDRLEISSSKGTVTPLELFPRRGCAKPSSRRPSIFFVEVVSWTTFSSTLPSQTYFISPPSPVSPYSSFLSSPLHSLHFFTSLPPASALGPVSFVLRGNPY